MNFSRMGSHDLDGLGRIQRASPADAQDGIAPSFLEQLNPFHDRPVGGVRFYPVEYLK
jgi:hypothetical protein